MGIGEDNTSFDQDDIQDLKNQPWVRSVGEFTGANFSVYASINIGGRGMSTYLFLEAIPDKYLDIAPAQWKFDPNDPTIPIIMSKDYLTLYNFGFAATRGMPQLSESLMSNIPITLTLSGGGHTEAFRAHIVGFSSRLNTIAVPETFLEWANGYFAPEVHPNPSRLIVEVNTPGDPKIDKYMAKHSYEIVGDKADNSKASYFLTLITSIVIVIGMIISLLALFILMLSIYLLLQKNKQKLHDLMLLGYRPSEVARSYYIMIGIVNLSVLVLAIVAMLLAAAWWTPRLSSIGVHTASAVPAILVGVVIIGVVTAINYIAIHRIVRRNFYNS
jgi:hypothetical protein